MQPNNRRAELCAPGAKNVAEQPNLTRIPIKSFHGQTKFYCKECGEFVPVAFLVRGTVSHPDLEGEIIIVDYLTDDLGHTIKEMSR